MFCHLQYSLCICCIFVCVIVHRHVLHEFNLAYMHDCRWCLLMSKWPVPQMCGYCKWLSIYKWTQLHFIVLSSAGRRHFSVLSQLHKVSIIFPSVISLLFFGMNWYYTASPSSSALPFDSRDCLALLTLCVFLQYDSYQISKWFTKRKSGPWWKTFLQCAGRSRAQRPALKVVFTSPNQIKTSILTF